jgi:hypothetical protein
VGHGLDEEHEIQRGFISLFGAPGSAGRHGGQSWRQMEIEYCTGGKPPVGIRRLEEGSLVPDWAGEEAREGKRRHRSRVIFT